MTESQQDDKEALPIPADAFVEWKNYSVSSGNAAPLIQTPQPGTWTCIAFHECVAPSQLNVFGPHPQTEVRYAFYAGSEDDEMKVFSGEQFLSILSSASQVGALVDKWKAAMWDLAANTIPRDEERLDNSRRDHYELGKVTPASAAEVRNALKLVSRYNEQIQERPRRGEPS